MREIADSSHELVPALTTPHEHAPPERLIRAETDEQAVAAWLQARAANSESTFDRYQREARRFLEYIQKRGRSLNMVTIEDVRAYEQDLLAGKVTGKPRSRAAVDGVFSVLASLTGLLSAAGYLRANVLVLRSKRKKKEGGVRVERFLSNEELRVLFDEAATLSGAPRDERIRFTLVWFLSTGSRISETLKAPMNSVYLAQEAGHSEWVWRVVRKGDVEMDVPLRHDAIDGLVRYRRSLGLPHYPAPDQEEGFLVWPLRGKSEAPLYRGTISQELKVFFERAAQRLDSVGQRRHMEQATTHWLRHTAATQLLDAGTSIRFVSWLLGHASQSITSRIYDHADRATWRRELLRGRDYKVSIKPGHEREPT
ncbi:tyrosine-type recombinase/integrase [Salinisphaera sp. T31B1]|uniref:tyrosine-type recombinase/integrase n=1 Tax=Salinisphaera sp. T31B1 TaxID=727963 RepID=UPI0033412CF7